jgi:hypothetical protein
MRNDHQIEDTGNLLIDLWRNTSPIVRTGLFGGLGLGLIAGLYFALFLDTDFYGIGRALWSPSLCALFSLTVVGTFVGLGLGVAVEMVVDKVRGRQDKKKGRRE